MTREELERQFPIGSFVQCTYTEKLQVVGYEAQHSDYWGNPFPDERCYLRVILGDEIYTFLSDNPQPYTDN